MYRFANLARIIGLLAVAVALVGCSAVKLGYNSVPQLSAWWLDGYIDLADDQEPRFRADFARLFEWHRRQELPKIGALLQQAEKLVGNDMTADEACAMVPAVRQRIAAVLERAEPAATTLALGLRPEQLTHLRHKYDKNNREYRKDWIELPATEVREKRLKQYLERAEMVYGRLDEQQRALVRNQLAGSVFSPETNLRERQRRQQDILQTLQKLAGQPLSLSEARAAIHLVMEHALHSPDPAYRSYEASLIQQGCRDLAALHQTTTPQQRQNAVRRLRAYQRDVEELAAEP